MQLAADAREELAWRPASHVMALIAEVNRDPKQRSRPYLPYDFWHLPAERRPKGGGTLTPDTLRALGPAIAGKL